MDGAAWFSLALFGISIYLVFFKWIPKIDAEKEAAREVTKTSLAVAQKLADGTSDSLK